MTQDTHKSKAKFDKPLIDLYRQEAKKLHRAVQSPKKHCALPVLRRLLNTKVFTGLSLAEFFSNREKVQRKHLFHLLAKESGYENWTSLKPHLHKQRDLVPHYSIGLKQCGHLNLWFSEASEAREYARINGGEVIIIGNQGAVLPKA